MLSILQVLSVFKLPLIQDLWFLVRMDTTNASLNTTTNRSFSGSVNSASPGNENESNDGADISSVVILDQHTCEPLHAFRLNPNEMACSIISANLEEDSAFYVVGKTIKLITSRSLLVIIN